MSLDPIMKQFYKETARSHQDRTPVSETLGEAICACLLWALIVLAFFATV